jgi:phosphatidylglycerol:prolipoprotein diacylglycerol transferase
VLREIHVPLPGGLHAVVGTHAVMVLVAVVAGAWLAARRAPRTGMAPAAVVMALAIMAGARMLHRLVRGGDGGVTGGLASMGGVVAGLLAAPVLARLCAVRLPTLADALAPAGLLALGIGRLGCFLAGCCYGSPTELPWGVVFPDLGHLPRHPLQLYSAAADVAISCAVARRPGPPGAAAARTLGAFAAARFALEWLRDPAATDRLPGVGVTLAQACCVALWVAARPWRHRPVGGLWRYRARCSVARPMRRTMLLALVAVAASAVRAAATDPDFVGSLVVRPARGTLAVATGLATLEVKRWRFLPAAASDGIDPAAEDVVLSVGADELTLPAGSVTTLRPGRRYAHRDDAVTRGLSRLRMKRRSDGSWVVGFRATGVDLTRLAAQYPLCEPFAFAVGNDEGASGVDLDRPRGAASPRVKLRGFCEAEVCPQTAPSGAFRPRHVVCP